MRTTETQFDSLSLREQLDLVLRASQNSQDPKAAERINRLRRAQEENPLLFFEPHQARDGKRPQMDFIQSQTPVVAAFAGNQFGKSTVLTVCALRECLPRVQLPPLLAKTKRFDAPASGWILCPTEDKIFDSFQPAFEEWCSKRAFKGGSWGKAFKGDRMQLNFDCGSTIQFKTYKQDHSTLGGARLHFVGYDEPPPRKHREECMMRLVRYGGYEMFAMTPLDANTGYVRREIWRKRERPDITVVRGSIHDNPTLDKATRARVLGNYSDIWRKAREFGDFVDMGGLIYPDFERCVVAAPWSPEFIRTLDIVVGIDPGIRNAGIVWVGFDSENVAHVFAAVILQDKVARDYAQTIKSVNARWGLSPTDIQYVCDPASRQRGQTNSETVQTALAKYGIYAAPGENDVQAGIDQTRTRMAHGRLKISPEREPGLLGLRDEADEYVGKEPEEGKDDSHMEPVKSHDHRLDALRYALMHRFWDPLVEQEAPDQMLGFELGRALPANQLHVPQEVHPMGPLY